MLCELCGQFNPGTCEHPKNAYCLLFNQQAKKDIDNIGKHRLMDLETGDTFRYVGSDENDWHVVTLVDENKVYYAGGYAGESNYRNEVKIIVK